MFLKRKLYTIVNESIGFVFCNASVLYISCDEQLRPSGIMYLKTISHMMLPMML